MFKDRHEAGVQLAARLEEYSSTDACILAIPRGGIEVGHPVACRLRQPMDVIIPRKVPCPDNPELALGAVTVDGSIEINQQLVAELGLGIHEVAELIRPVRLEIERRMGLYRRDRPCPSLRARHVILVDDGLATGYTMMAGIKSVRREFPAKVIVAVPVSPASTYERILELADHIVVLHLARDPFFAVSSYYENFRDRPEEQLVSLLEQSHVIALSAQSGFLS